MHRQSLVLMTTATCVAISLLALATPRSWAADPPTISPAPQRLSHCTVTVETDKMVYNVGDKIYLTVKVTNHNSRAVYYYRGSVQSPSPDGGYSIDKIPAMERVTGQLVATEQGVPGEGHRSIAILPLSTKAIAFAIHPDNIDGSPRVLGPGKYLITVNVVLQPAQVVTTLPLIFQASTVVHIE